MNVFEIAFVLVILAAAVWVNNDKEVCDYALKKVQAVYFCRDEPSCSVTTDDFEALQFWSLKAVEHCGKEE